MEINTFKNKLFAQQDLTVDESIDLFEFIMMFFISMNLPAGAVLYWAVSQVISTIQQMLVMKQPSAEVIDVKAK